MVDFQVSAIVARKKSTATHVYAQTSLPIVSFADRGYADIYPVF
jgi:hypothetical protein